MQNPKNEIIERLKHIKTFIKNEKEDGTPDYSILEHVEDKLFLLESWVSNYVGTYYTEVP